MPGHRIDAENRDLPQSATLPPPAPQLAKGLAGTRVFYDGQSLLESGLASTPLAQFQLWYEQATAAGVPEPNAMTLATVDAAGLPSARTVLMKDAGPRGFSFFTNHSSRKGLELAARPAAALVLPWLTLHRQVAVRGRVEALPAEVSREYFSSRPWASRIGAWASRQSQPVADRQVLDGRWAELAARYPDRGGPDDVPLPPFWGGYLVRPFEVEFWQGRASRMHDRLVFLPIRDGDEPDADSPHGADALLDDPAAWRVERREP